MAELDIIVTHYKEPVEIVRRFLDSLNSQTFKDFKVYIVDDGYDCPDLTDLLVKYDFPIINEQKEHKTVSSARNYGLDHTDSPYLMFCDCDDMFDESNPHGLLHAMNRIKMNNLMVYRSVYKCEAWKKSLNSNLSALYKKDENEEDELVQIVGNINPSTIHSKIYNRKFVLDNGIRFLDDLWMNEDGVFNGLARDLCLNKGYRTFNDCEVFYIWKYNGDSVTRTNKLYPLLGYDQFVKATYYVNERMESLTGKMVSPITNAHFIFQAYYWLYLYSDRFMNNEMYDELMGKAMEEVYRFVGKHGNCVTEEIIEKVEVKTYIDNFMKKLDKCDMSKKMSFIEWLSQVREIIAKKKEAEDIFSNGKPFLL